VVDDLEWSIAVRHVKNYLVFYSHVLLRVYMHFRRNVFANLVRYGVCKRFWRAVPRLRHCGFVCLL